MPAAALRGLANSGSPASSRSRFVRSNAARGRKTSPRTSTRPAGPPRSASGMRADRPDVGGHVLAARAVAARRAAHEHAVLVGQRDAQAVDLQLGDVGDRRVAQAGALPHALVEGAQLLLVVGVVEAEHRRQMLDRREALGGPAGDALRRRVRRDEIGMLRPRAPRARAAGGRTPRRRSPGRCGCSSALRGGGSRRRSSAARWAGVGAMPWHAGGVGSAVARRGRSRAARAARRARRSAERRTSGFLARSANSSARAVRVVDRPVLA